MLAAPLLPAHAEHTDANILSAMKTLRYPVYATVKMDGIRALRLNGTLLSRTLKEIPNKSIRKRSLKLPGGFDMELCAEGLRYDEVESIVMSKKHNDSHKIQFYILDWYGILDQHGVEANYRIRQQQIDGWIGSFGSRMDGMPVCFYICNDYLSLFEFFLESERRGDEGICFRTPDSPYKFGRSTLREQWLIKLCRYHRTECVITGFEEQMENDNAEEYNSVGKMDRSSCKDNLIPKDTLGAFIVTHNLWGTMRVGTGVGLTDKLRKEIWENRDRYHGKVITVKFKPHGSKDKPRSPIYVGFRKDGI